MAFLSNPSALRVVRVSVASLALLLAACGDATPSGDDASGSEALPAIAAIPAVPAMARPAPPSGPVAPSTAAMAARLAKIADETRPEDNVYVNDRRADALAAQIDAEGGPDSARIMLVMDQARESLLAGRTDVALRGFGVAERRLAEAPAQVNPDVLRELHRMITLAWLRLGEQQNCLFHHDTRSCLLPIEGNGVHGERLPSETARDRLLDELAADPTDWTARWLLNVTAMTLGEWPDGVDARWLIPPSAFASGADPGRFDDVAQAAHANLVSLAGGVCAEDFDGDGLLDLFVTSWGMRDNVRLLHNAGDGTFADVTAAAGLSGITGGLNALHADYDDDGDPDVLVLRGAWFETKGGHPNSLLRNEGDGTFVDVTEQAGLGVGHPTQAANFADYDGDGWLDLFVGNETGPNETHPCELFHNRGDGGFEDVAPRVGLALEAYVKGVAWGDVDGDGDPDLYVSRIDGPNRLFRNDGPATPRAPTGMRPGAERIGAAAPGGPRPAGPAGPGDDAAEDDASSGAAGPMRLARLPAAPFEPWIFTDVTEAAGVAEPKRSFPTWFFDADDDGDLDLFVSGYRYGSAGHVAKDYLGLPNKGVEARFYRNRGDGTFDDASHAAGVDHVLLTMGCNFGDLDEDGFLDFYVSTGEPDLAGIVPNRMFLNDRAGGFVDVTTAGGFGHLQKGHGVAFADLDDDGDQDVYAVMGGAYSGDVFPNALFLNPGHGRRTVTLELHGTRANASAIGARVRVRLVEPQGRRDVFVTVGTGGSFGSSSLQQEVGCGDATSIAEVEIAWPGSGTRELLHDVPLDRHVTVREGQGVVAVREYRRLPMGGAH
ncbi:MAG: CRTAC1 family protein [Planctomycetes bacterium]|nr:CRTAC1 family protein [Planctomycetota bacterium]